MKANYSVCLTWADKAVNTEFSECVRFAVEQDANDFADCCYRSGRFSSAVCTGPHGRVTFDARREQVVFA